MTIWNTDMSKAPTGRPVLLRMEGAPIGWSSGDGSTVAVGQRGNNGNGFWIAEGFFADEVLEPKPGSWIFKAWTEIPAFDA